MGLPISATGHALAPGFRDTALFRPRRVALLADPRIPVARLLARNMAEGGFTGPLHAVGHPWDGMALAVDPGALPEPPDLAVVALPPQTLDAAFAALAARGCRAAVVPTAAPGLADLAARHGIRALGEHSFGLCIPELGLNASLSHLKPRPGRLALLCQSAALARAVLDWAEGESVGFSLIAGIGTNADYGFAGALDWLARDAATGAILLDIRRIKDRRRFVSAARAAARTRPVVAERPGHAAAEGRSLPDAVMAAALRRAGVLRVEGLDDLLSAAETLARVRPANRGGPEALRGDRVAIVTNGQGPGWMAADAARRGGGRLAEIPEAARSALALALPDGWAGGNPLVLPMDQGHRLAEAAVMLAGLPEVDSVVAVHAPAPEEDPAVAAEALAAAVTAARANRSAPVLAAWLGMATARPARTLLASRGVAVFATPEAAVRGALHLAQDRRNRAAAAELPPRDVLETTPDRAAVEAVLAAVRAKGRLNLDEHEALSLLDAYGIATVRRRVASTPEEAGRAAFLLGGTCVLKVLSADLPQKTEVGGVVLNLSGGAAVAAAARDMQARLRALRPGIVPRGFLVQAQAERGTELRLRLGDDPMFGPWIGFGRGGTAADLDGDESHDLPPLNLTLARAMIGRTRASRLLAGYRDHSPAPLDVVAEALIRLSQLAVDFPEIAAFTVNPLRGTPDGVVALDATATLRPAGQRGLLAISPYPAELARPVTLRDGRSVVVRPIRPEDAEALADAFRRLSPEDVRYRFFNRLREIPAAQLARLTQIDYDREMAFVAVPHDGSGAGVARLVLDPAATEGEFAIVVDRDWKGAGLARHLMGRLIEWGRSRGLGVVAGQVLADNVPMLRFVRALGFRTRATEDPEVIEARLDL
ncbi:GNAT family N-acetyltransferase [Roseomonas sp. CCTCC AB2023176]|uniref:bifunctional acetate--CoA ligase family protein/GNAT family N-acetyltransferase n=1 Tax=Roseomonas sp. CCTCC AB2023176 TaxID=3342640 RepID=UPI0035DCBCD5